MRRITCLLWIVLSGIMGTGSLGFATSASPHVCSFYPAERLSSGLINDICQDRCHISSELQKK